MKTMQIDIVSAEAEIWSGKASAVFAPGSQGELGIYPGHTALITQLIPGDLRVLLEDGAEHIFYISGGILEVQPHVATVLSDVAYRAADLDEAQVLAARKRAEEALRDSAAELDYAQVQAELASTAAQLRAIQKMRKLRK